MICGAFSLARNWSVSRLLLGTLMICMTAAVSALGAPQAGSDIPPDATPQIQQITPDHAAPGDHVTVTIQGKNFSEGAYVTSVSAAIHVESSKRVSATELEAQLGINGSAQPGTLSLLVSNPASGAAEIAFKIVAGQAVVPAKLAAEVKPSAPATPAVHATPPPVQEVKPSVPATPAVHVAPPVPVAPATPTGPQVASIEPPRVGLGFDVDLKITGKNFVTGTKVSFANTGIRVMGITSSSSTKLTVHIKVASDATPGRTSMFVINPDDSEVESPFEVTTKGTPSPQALPTPSSPTPVASADTQRYDAFHLGNPAEVFQVHGKVKGALIVSSGTLKYEEDGKTLINISLSEIREIKTSSIATATFHVTLTSGKTFHFAPGSLRPADARNMVDSLRKALPH